MTKIVFVHGMFQNPKSWDHWVQFFSQKGYDCLAPAWPLHEGEPALLRLTPPDGLGTLSLDDVYASIEAKVSALDKPVVIGHSVGGLIAQKLLAKGLVSAAVGISSVAPNGMLEWDWSFIKNSAAIANPLKGDEPIFLDGPSFHASFANTLSDSQAALAFAETATLDSRNVLRDCMGASGKIDVTRPHNPLLLIGAEDDQIIPADLAEKNFKAYEEAVGVTDFRRFAKRSHYICGEPGWEGVAAYIDIWLQKNQLGGRQAPATYSNRVA